MPKLKEVDIYGVGLFLGDKVQGDFKLEVLEIIASKEKMLPKNSSSGLLELSE